LGKFSEKSAFLSFADCKYESGFADSANRGKLTEPLVKSTEGMA